MEALVLSDLPPDDDAASNGCDTVRPRWLENGASASPVLRVSGLRRDFGDLTAVDGFDLDLAAGECVSLIGHNGSGKTTALRVTAGQLVPTSGTVTMGGADEHDRWHGHVALARLGSCPTLPSNPDAQHFSLFPGRSRLGRREFIEPHNPFALR